MQIDRALFLVLLACVAVVQALTGARARVAVLLVASLVFYAFSGIGNLVLMMALCGINYWAALTLGRDAAESQRTRIFAAIVGVNLGVLVLFKYSGSALGELLCRLGWCARDGAAVHIGIPLGLSYFIFTMLSCLTDAYRRTWRPGGGLARFALFGLFFPQISSGPIPRAERLLPQVAEGGLPSADLRAAGIRLIAFGFFKKYVVANRLSDYVSSFFGNPGAASTPAALIGCCLNALQLYADFSGYVDIALGSAAVLGVRLDLNFDRPFSSTSVTEFWRRWHMTLAFWLRDYLYMPLVIRLRNLGKTGVVLAMMFTFAIIGIWHAATWTYLLFGVSQGVALTVEFLTRNWRGKQLKRVPKRAVVWSGMAYTLGFFVLSQVLFRSSTLKEAGTVYSQLLHPHMAGNINELLGGKPFNVSMDFFAIGLWAAVAWIFSHTSDRSAPWFAGLCAILILFFGCLGSAHFIYAAF